MTTNPVHLYVPGALGIRAVFAAIAIRVLRMQGPGTDFVNIKSPAMGIVYYKIPLRLGAAMGGEELPLCDLDASIQKNLELIILTKFGEHRSNPTFGCEVWNLDFELIVSARSWEEKLRQSLMKSITLHETRLGNAEITVAITDMEKFNIAKQFVDIKKRVDIHINGVIKKTNEPFTFHTNLFLSPLSAD